MTEEEEREEATRGSDESPSTGTRRGRSKVVVEGSGWCEGMTDVEGTGWAGGSWVDDDEEAEGEREGAGDE